MIQYVGVIVQFILYFLMIFWINRDIKRKEIDRKWYWIWIVVLILVLFMLGIVETILMALVYYFWSRHIH